MSDHSAPLPSGGALAGLREKAAALTKATKILDRRQLEVKGRINAMNNAFADFRRACDEWVATVSVAFPDETDQRGASNGDTR